MRILIGDGMARISSHQQNHNNMPEEIPRESGREAFGISAHILPDVLHRVQLGRARGQEDWLYVRRHFELAGRMPARPVHEQHSYRALGDMTRDFIEV